MGVTDIIVDAIGFSAGVLVASSLLPQIWRAHKRGSAKDLSFIWQGTVMTGVSLQLVYLYHYEMWAVFIPLLSELFFIVYLASLKTYFEYGPGAGGDRPPPAGSNGEGKLFLGGDGDDGSEEDGGGGGGGGGQAPSSGGTGGGSAAPAADALGGVEEGKGGRGGRGA
ncbi:unnamed protein product [Ectocarpus sp. 12 AP-2014]